MVSPQIQKGKENPLPHTLGVKLPNTLALGTKLPQTPSSLNNVLTLHILPQASTVPWQWSTYDLLLYPFPLVNQRILEVPRIFQDEEDHIQFPQVRGLESHKQM